MTKVYISARQCGKTTALIKESAKTGAPIAVASYQMAKHVKDLAKRLNLDIPEPVTYHTVCRDFEKGVLMPGISNSHVWILKHEDGLLEINEIEGVFGSEEKAKAELENILKNYPEDIREDKRGCFNVVRMEVR